MQIEHPPFVSRLGPGERVKSWDPPKKSKRRVLRMLDDDMFSMASSDATSVELRTVATTGETKILLPPALSPKPPLHRHVPKKNRSGKNVVFAMDQKTKYEAPFVIDRGEDVWYSTNDYQRFQEDATSYTKAVARGEDLGGCADLFVDDPPYSEMVWGAYRCFVDYSRTEARLRAPQQETGEEPPLPQLEVDQRFQLERVLRHFGAKRVGMETRIVPGIRCDSLDRRLRLWQTVRASSNSRNPEGLRQECQQISRPSRAFAATMARAHVGEFGFVQEVEPPVASSIAASWCCG